MPPQRSKSSRRPRHLDKPEDSNKAAYDAILVAVGIVAVLVANVAYAGYLTTPGGPDPYWADCYYPIFVAFTYLDGFSLVFAVAAIFAVTFGPAFLIWEGKGGWRAKVVRVSLVHLALSLLAFMGAFACAGFVTALVNSPPLTCGLIRCSEGGVPCISTTIKTFDTNTSTGVLWPLDSKLVNLNRATFSLGRNESKADLPIVICANYNTISGSPVRLNYPADSALQREASIAHHLTPLLSYREKKNTSCLFLNPNVADEGFISLRDHGPSTWCSAFPSWAKALENNILGTDLELSGYSVHNFMKLLSYQMEWLRTWSDEHALVLTDMFSSFDAVFADWFALAVNQPITSRSAQAFCLSEADWHAMPAVSQLLRPEKYNVSDWRDLLHKEGTFDPALLPPTPNYDAGSNYWNYNFKHLYGAAQLMLYVQALAGDINHTFVIPECDLAAAVPGAIAGSSCVGYNMLSYGLLPATTLGLGPLSPWIYNTSTYAAHIKEHAGQLRWHTLSHAPPPLTGPSDQVVISAIHNYLTWRGEFDGSQIEYTAGPLAGVATNYATLRYICSGGVYPVLCDKGYLDAPIEPPLAVDPEGNYLTRKDIIKYSGRDVSVSQTTTQLQSGVIAMLVVAAFANTFTIVWLAFGEPFCLLLWGRLAALVLGRLQAYFEVASVSSSWLSCAATLQIRRMLNSLDIFSQDIAQRNYAQDI